MRYDKSSPSGDAIVVVAIARCVEVVAIAQGVVVVAIELSSRPVVGCSISVFNEK